MIKWIKTDNIKYSVGTYVSFRTYKPFGMSMPGDWDKKYRPFENTCAYKTMEAMCINGKSYMETSECCRIQKAVDAGTYNFTWEPAAAETRLKELFESVKTEGVKANEDKNDQIAVLITRDGKMLCTNGRHRLAAAKLLGVEMVPVVVYARHPEWIRFLAEFKPMAEKYWGQNKIYQTIDHIDFMDYKIPWQDNRINIIKENTKLNPCSILDIGSLFANIPFKMEKHGYKCTALELNPDYYKVIEKIKVANDSNIGLIKGSFYDIQDVDYDIICAFNIFHHSLKTEKYYNKLKDFLGRIKFNEMYFQAHRPEEKQMEGAYKNYAPDQFASFISDNLSFKTIYYKIGEERGRVIYKFERI